MLSTLGAKIIMWYYINITDMGEVSDRGGLRQAELGCRDHCCSLHYLLSDTTGDKWTTTETSIIQKVYNTHTFSVHSCKLIDVCDTINHESV